MPDDKLIARLRSRLPDKFSHDLLDTALHVLPQTENKLRAHQFASSLRELIGHVLEIMAPDKDVMRCPWYKQDKDVKGPTRRQRALYTCRGGLPDSFLKDRLKLDPADLHAEFGNAFQELNKQTHARPETVVTDPDAIEEFANAALAAFIDLFEVMDDVRERVTDAISDKLRGEAAQVFINETIQELDEISSHYSTDIVWIEEAEVLSLDADSIKYRMKGSVDVTLLYGSASDRAGDTGAELKDNFPYTCETAAPAADPTKFNSTATTMKVDTSSWFGKEEAVETDTPKEDDH